MCKQDTIISKKQRRKTIGSRLMCSTEQRLRTVCANLVPPWRASRAAGHPTESVTLAKQKKITRSALVYLKQKRWLNHKARFDVIAILWPRQGEAPQLQHYIHAFEPTGFGQMYS